VPPPPSVDRIRRVWQAQAGGAREQAVFALLMATLVGGAHLARLGTVWARALSATAVLGIVVVQVALFIARRREAGSTRLTVRRVVVTTDPALGFRALRAQALVVRAEEDESVGSRELADLHFSRILDRVSSDAVRGAAVRYAQRFRGAAVALLSIASIAVVTGPSRVVEGLDVLAARHGRAPLPMSFIGYPRIAAQPPSYTRESERSLVFGTSVGLPKGSVLTVRGVPLSPGYRLVVTDGSHEEPFSDDGAGGIIARYVLREKSVKLRVAARFGDVRIDDEETLEITTVPDAPPSVEVEGAPRTVRLSELDRIDVRWTAKDDHGLREIDLVMRSGAREERRVLARFDGETKVERGGRVIAARDAFLRRMFLPVFVTVEVKDNDPFDGPKWSHSAAIVVVPPEVGQPEAERLLALRTVRDGLVDLLAWRSGAGAMLAADRVREGRDRLRAVTSRVENVLSATYAGSPMPRALGAFVDGQLDKLGKQHGDIPVRAIEDAVLAVDAAVSGAGNRDAVDVAKRLGDVAEEAAVDAHGARLGERGAEAAAGLDTSIDAIVRGAGHLETLAALGGDLGGVALGDAGRIRRARDARDFLHAELAALHLAERLRRPAPSFGATTGGGRGGGVESGRGKGEPGLPPPSSADEDFGRAANEVSELAEEHEGTLRGVESALEEASRAEPTDAERKEAKRLADAVRRAAEPLPLPGQDFGTPRAATALVREHANAAAHALDDMSLAEATESAEGALGALGQAERKLDPSDPIRDDLKDVRRALGEAKDWANRQTERRRAEAEARAGSAVRQAGDTERGLAERAERLAREPEGREATLPHDLAERLNRAGSIMREAARELGEGHGDRGVARQREAQRLLEQARPERSGEPGDNGEEDGERGSARRPEGDVHGGRAIATGGDVPAPDDKARAEEFRKRVLDGLGREKSERLSPAVQRYAEGLLR
jgi:hypothetical protein